MQRRALGFLILVVLFAAALFAAPQPARCAEARPELAPGTAPDALVDLTVLRAAYPDVVLGLEQDASGQLVLALANGQRLVYDDGRVRDAQQALEAPDLRTMLAQVYPLGPVDESGAHPGPDFDPGRARVQALFAALYGASEAEVRRNCETVRFGGHGVAFNVRQGAAQALARVWRRIEALLPQHPEFRAVLQPLGGSLAWRRIAGTKRLSMHSFGVAIDLNPHLPYWRSYSGDGGGPGDIAARRRSFPPELLAAFEAEGFIWGGKWASFDLMHFEYRPEILLKARVLAGELPLP